MTEVWAEYEKWNEAIAQVVFPTLDVPKPVYLDLEDDLLQDIGAVVAVEGESVETALASAVAQTLRHNAGPATIFGQHQLRMQRWIRGKRKGTPPFLAVLATFCIAAEQMTAGDGMSSSNYYGRLRSVLGWDQFDTRLDKAYQRVSERFWGELNRWLVELDGMRGLPTAYALSHRFVGLSVSQALIRSTDHEKLKEFFRQYGFAPGADVAPSDLVLPLGDWLNGTPSPVTAGLQRLWKAASARDRIAEAAAVSLANWDGSVRERAGGDPTTTAGTLALTLEIGGFPRKRFALSALFYVNEATIPRTATVLTADPPAEVELIPDLPGALGLGRGSALHPGDVLEGILRIKDDSTDRVLERRPRRLVVFREDELSRRWIESPQVMLGDNVRLLAYEGLLTRLEEVLGQIARPGWKVAHPYPGQPEGWVVLTDVEIFNHPGDLVNANKMDDLLPLVPLTSSQLKVAGGFALPGRVRGKWHSWAAPEVRAVSDAPGGFTVRLLDTHRYDDATEGLRESTLAEWSDEGTGVVVRSLSDLELPDGDYRLELLPHGARDPLTSTSLILRSSDTPDMHLWASANPVAYAGGIGVTGASVDESGDEVKGHHAPMARLPKAPAVKVPARAGWRSGRHQAPMTQAPVRITVPDENSCIRTGRHVEIVETVLTDAQGKPLQAWSHGRCKGCGLVRRYPTRLKWSSYGRGREHKDEAPTERLLHDLSAVAPVADQPDRNYATAFDALLHTGGGRWSQFERIALQLEPTALFVDQFARTLEVLGHLDIRRDPKTLEPTDWEVAPTAVSGTGEDYLFAGFWPNGLYAETGERLERHGLDLISVPVVDAPSQYFVDAKALPPEVVDELAEQGVPVIERAWQQLAAFLPPLSKVLAGLPRQSASLEGDFSLFQTLDASWAKVHSMDAPGAYRVRRFSTLDVFRSPEDVEQGTVARTTVQLGKHLAALLDGRPLLAYDHATSSLLVPLGADLPGLYGRAAVAASGVPPVAIGQEGLLKYEAVPEELARHLYQLMSN